MIGKIISHYAPKAYPFLADKILEKLGEGGMGFEYKARDIEPHGLSCLNFPRRGKI